MSARTGASVLVESAAPRAHARHAIGAHARWFRWSPEVLRFCEEFEVALRSVRPSKVVVRDCKPYGVSYHVSLRSAPSPVFRDGLRRLARGLLAHEVARRAVLLRDIFTPPVDRRVLHGLFAWLRAALVEHAADPRAALYSPPTVVRGNDNEFLLHADLFVAKRLLLVFDDVPSDGTGQTLLLPRAAFVAALRRSRTLPVRKRQSLMQFLDRPLRFDSFDRFFEMVHGANPWSTELANAMYDASFAIPFARGEGYLVHDRQWLHGRKPVSGAVRSFRFHRLVFGL